MIQFHTFQPANYPAVCDFLVALSQQDRTHRHWNWARFEWMYCHPYCDRAALDSIGLWFDGGKVVGAAIFDLYYGEAFCAAMPSCQHLLPEIYEYAYENLKDDQGLSAAISVSDHNTHRLLASLGYTPTDQKEHLFSLPLTKTGPYCLPEGYSIQEIHLPEDQLAYQTVIWKGFDHEGDMAEWEKMRSSAAPLPPHLDSRLCLAVTDENGEFLAHCTCWYDSRTDYAYIEPVCTIPAHRGRGLGKAVVLEALNRCRRLGIKEALVLSDQVFYQKLGFTRQAEYIFFRKKN